MKYLLINVINLNYAANRYFDKLELNRSYAVGQEMSF